MSAWNFRLRYSDDQLDQLLRLFEGPHSPKHQTVDDLRTKVKKAPLETLKWLQMQTLCTVPFGNLGLHYSLSKQLSLDPQDLFVKIVDRKLGGYCMENNAFFFTILYTFGYNVYSTGARIGTEVDGGRPGGFKGWSHMVNLVTIDGKKYLVDIGFGARGAVAPVLLQHGITMDNVPTSQGQLLYRTIEPSIDQSQKMWVFEVRNSPEEKWMAVYCFGETEFLPQDFDSINYATSNSRASWFSYRLVLQRMVADNESKKIIGTIVMSGEEMKQRADGETLVLATCKTEADRVKALKTFWDIELRPDEIRGIRGTVTALPED